jgi:hypothetical protein
MPGPSSSRDDRVFVRDGRRHHRPVYSRVEFRLGLGVLAVLAAIAVWVAWRGGRPDPEIFQTGEALLAELPDGPQPVERTGAQAPSVGRAASGPAVVREGTEGAAGAGGGAAAASGADRGPLPGGLAAEGWTEGPVSTFGYDDLYVKINGREDYYKTFGFRQLWFVSITSDADPATAVDVEVYDLAETANALGAYAGERAPGAKARIGPGGMGHLDRNALMLTRGRYYVRAIGSDETPAIRAQLEHLRTAFESGLEGGDLPASYAIFTGGLGLDPGEVAYTAENAFSFGFAKDVYSARLEDESEIFAVEAGEDAAALATRFREGFQGYGEAAGGSIGVEWTKDRYLGTFAGAKAVGGWTIGVKDAPDRAAAEAALGNLEDAVRVLEAGAER